MEIHLESKEFFADKSVHFCIPCYGGMLNEKTFSGFIRWVNLAKSLDMPWTVDTLGNESLVTRARNTLVAKFLANPSSTHLMFIDADIAWEPWQVLALLSAKKHIIGGLYPMKKFPIDYVINHDANMIEEPPLLEVTATGTGFMLISREALIHMQEHQEVVKYIVDTDPAAPYAPFARTYFDTAIRDGRYLSEDWEFCRRWRELGGRIWVHNQVEVGHIGAHEYRKKST